MNPRHSSDRSGSGRLTRTLLFILLLVLPACAPHPTPALFIPPTAAPVLPTSLPSADTGATGTVPTFGLTVTAIAITSTPCTNNLSYVQDLTIPDGAAVTPGEPVDKQWLVTNSGSCNWNADYRLRLISGESMQATQEQALYPARAGTQATLRIVFTAPEDSGAHQSAWQAISPEGIAFGDAVYMQISVSP